MAPIFALDIGTRSVVGIILEEVNQRYHVIDLEVIEHKERSMIDGQIHNIISVASVIEQMKTLLEERHGPLKKVSVAAAGRALKTAEGKMTVDITANSLIHSEDINRLELGAVQIAQQELLSSDSISSDNQYYCVGYSVLHYYLDDEKIGSLIEQTGRTASVEVIATFLPRVVVESLLSALKRADLEMEALTLEPIAAINVLIPQSMRRLNVALVDIGAGTSDIAITNHNTVTAFGMVPIAGDEVTEVLSSAYLLDFPEAERVKRSLHDSESVVLTDILGFEQSIAVTEIAESLSEATDRLAQAIAHEIKRLNNKPPQAVMLVGGGSLTPGLSAQLSGALDLPLQRIAVRGLDALADVTLADHIQSSPAFVTPIGIAIAAKRAPIHYLSVSVNEKVIRLFELKDLTIGDALLAAGVKAKQLYGKPGLALRFTLNGQEITLPGSHGTPSVILKNGIHASAKDFIQQNDSIELLLGEDGRSAHATIADVIELKKDVIQVEIDSEPVMLTTDIRVNNEPQNLQTVIQDRDKITIEHSLTLGDALNKLQSSETNDELQSVVLNGKRIQLKSKSAGYTRNGLPITLTTVLEDGDYIISEQSAVKTIADIVKKLGIELYEQLTVTFNGEQVTIRKPRFSIVINNENADSSALIAHDDQIVFTPHKTTLITFSDIFACVDYQLPMGSVTSYELLRNKQPIQFYDQIFGGDELEILLT
ncbi:cell division protein FtsA [Sporosarcina aquimarina]|uniref:Cell division FtsA domain-containing protein n=1 Tax=Sporosarcina aquimarina TaxID=114975 RepID=A0ABU4G053_9BACL|nr:cell division FtsA domain-containing protein [Sporosarcina aquimarina]MDW0110328.1 cell division FtsA domain-containing protein [Sporosarcina aquimarina]